MTESTTGSGFSERLEGRISEHTDAIEGFSRARGLPEAMPRAVDQYLNMARSEIRGMTSEDLAEAAFEVSAYAYFLQDEVNKAQVKVDKLTHEINKRAYPAAEGEVAFKFDDKLLLATLADRVARDLHDMRAVAQGYLARWAKLGYLLSDLARRIDTIREEKRRG